AAEVLVVAVGGEFGGMWHHSSTHLPCDDVAARSSDRVQHQKIADADRLRKLNVVQANADSGEAAPARACAHRLRVSDHQACDEEFDPDWDRDGGSQGTNETELRLVA